LTDTLLLYGDVHAANQNIHMQASVERVVAVHCYRPD